MQHWKIKVDKVDMLPRFSMGHIYLSRPIPQQFMPVPSHGIPITLL